MLTDVLYPVVRANQPAAAAAAGALSAPLLSEWHATVLRVKNDVGQWVNKHSKHIPVRCSMQLCRQSPLRQCLQWRMLPCVLFVHVLPSWGGRMYALQCPPPHTTYVTQSLAATVRQAGYPLVTVLVCLVDSASYNALVDSMADFLSKQMKAKDHRQVGLCCCSCLSHHRCAVLWPCHCCTPPPAAPCAAD